MAAYEQYPLMLAGPILRRTEPRSVSVWLALGKPAKVNLSIWQNFVDTGFAAGVFTGPDPLHTTKQPTDTIRLGENLHVVLVTLQIPQQESPLLPETLYSYNVSIQYTQDGQARTDDLKSLALLRDGPLDGKPHLALGYDENFLPSFSLCPTQLTDLKIIYGTCRRPHKGLSDGMAWVDDFIKQDRTNPTTRPHQLLLGGDQIYADDVSDVLLRMLMYTAKNLIGMIDDISIEQVTIGKFKVPVDAEEIPWGLRKSLTLDEAKMTSADGNSHLIGFGEFCAMYLYVWSNACWPPLEEFPKAEQLLKYDIPLSMPDKILGKIERGILWKMHAFGELTAEAAERFMGKSLTDSEREEMADFIETEKHAYIKGLNNDIDSIKRFHSTLDRVRRALANVPTYMIFDDHEVTDDWNLNPMWMDRVYTSQLGRDIIRNALTSYTAFQAWGNDPQQFAKDGPNKTLLTNVAKYFQPAATPNADLPMGPDEDVIKVIDDLIGLDEHKSKVKWHFDVTGPRHKIVAIDNRTQRSFVSRIGPPGNLSPEALVTQIPAAPMEAGIDILILVAPLQVIGAPVFDELIAPAVYRTFDAFSYSSLAEHKGTAGMAGTNPDAIEAWAFDAKTLEALLKRLEPYRKVVILSGDVHYGSSQVMSYWRKGKTEPARFAQFTSSGVLNVMPSYIRAADRSLSFLQQVLRSDIGAERIGWDKNSPPPMIIEDDSSLVPALKSKLKQTPVMLPTHGWPEGTKINKDHVADWSWRVTPIIDKRPDQERPEDARPLPLFDDPKQDIENNLDGYRRVLRRHIEQLQKMNNSRQILFSNNLGVVHFEMQNDNLVAVNDLYTVFPFDLPHYQPAELYTHHTAQLTGVSEQSPEDQFA